MIKGQLITCLQENNSILSCDDFCYKNGIHYLPYYQKNIFHVLSIDSVPFQTGSLTVDSVRLLPTGFVNGSASVIDLSIENVGSLLLVSFYKDGEREAKQFYKKISLDFRNLKFLADTEEKKKDKIEKLKTILVNNKVSYFLIDFNNPLNYKNRLLWEATFFDYESCGFFLSKNIEKSESISKRKPKDEQSAFLSYRIPLVITSFLTTLSCCCARSFQIETSSYWIVSLVAALLLLVTSIVIEIFFSKKKIKNDFKIEKLFSFELFNCLSNLVGFIIALLMVWVLSKKMIFFASQIFEGMGLMIITLLGYIFLFAPAIIGRIVCKTRKDFL